MVPPKSLTPVASATTRTGLLNGFLRCVDYAIAHPRRATRGIAAIVFVAFVLVNAVSRFMSEVEGGGPVPNGSSETFATATVTPTPAPPTAPEKALARWSGIQGVSAGRLRADTSIDGGVVRGEGGLAWDLSACPVGWNADNGVVGVSIRVGILAPPKTVAAVRAYVDFRNRLGGIGLDGAVRSVELVQLADLADLELAAPRLAALMTAGADDERAARIAASACLPHLSFGQSTVATPSPPGWTAGLGMDPAVEGALWAQSVLRDLPDGGGAALIVADPAVGEQYVPAFRNGLAAANWPGTVDLVTAAELGTQSAVFLIVGDDRCDEQLSALASTPRVLTVWVPTGCLVRNALPDQLSVRRLDGYRSPPALAAGDDVEQWVARIFDSRP